MPVDFRDAAERHYEDAGYLLADDRLADADHLFGLSGECALKAVMLSLGMALRPDGAPADGHHRVHINKLWTEFITFANDRSGAHYTSRMPDASNPFDDWDVNQRYHHRSGITSEVIEKHRQATIKTRQVLETAVLNGDVI